MSSVKQPRLVFGTANVTAGSTAFSTVEETVELLDAIEKLGIKQLDTAQLYGTSEQLLGQVNAASRFTIDTKHIGGWVPGNSSRAKVVERGLESLKKLGVDKVFYSHFALCRCVMLS